MLPADGTYLNNYIDMYRNNERNSNQVLFILLQALHYYGEARMMNIVTG